MIKAKLDMNGHWRIPCEVIFLYRDWKSTRSTQQDVVLTKIICQIMGLIICLPFRSIWVQPGF